jgi:uncharacterized protein (TIGR02058 family)
MTRKRFIVELGYGADLHGRDMTKAACRAVQDALSRNCLCGLTVRGVELPELGEGDSIAVAVAALTVSVDCV